MKILLTVHQFFPEYFSGTEVLTFSVAKELMRRGHQVFVFTGFPARHILSDPLRFDEYDIDGVHVYRFHHTFLPMGEQRIVSEIEYNNHLVARYFVCLLKDLKPDIVHFFHFSRLGAALIDVVQHYGIPAFYTPTDFWAICPTSQLLLGEGKVCKGPTRCGGNCVKHVALLTRWKNFASLIRFVPSVGVDAFAAIANWRLTFSFPFKEEIVALSRRKSFNVSRLNALQGIVSPTRLMTDVLIWNGVDKNLITQSAYGIDVAGFNSETRRYDAQPTITFGYIGTLAPHKGCHVLIEAFNSLNAENARLKIYGNTNEFPDYVADLKRVAAGSDRIKFCGTFPNSKIAEVLNGIDVLVVPSVWYENTPLVVYSALTAKCPVIASNYPGMSEVVRDGWNGLLFAPGDAQILRECLSQLLSDPEFLTVLSKNCERPKSITAYVDELLQLYAQAPRMVKNSLADLQLFEPFDNSLGSGYIIGWAVASLTTPTLIRLCDEDKEVGVTTRFLPRPDVRDGLRKAGFKVNTDCFGFVINFSSPVRRSAAILEIQDHDGQTHRLEIARLNVGTSVQLGAREFVGLDQGSFPQESTEA